MMKKLLLILGLFFFGISGYAQEFAPQEGIYIGDREVRPSLSYFAPEVPSQNLSLTEVNFNKIEKREVNFVAVMEKERVRRQNAFIELDFAAPILSRSEKLSIEITNDFRLNDRDSNYDFYTGKKKNPAYQEMRPLLFNGIYSPYTGRSYGYPYSSRPFLR